MNTIRVNRILVECDKIGHLNAGEVITVNDFAYELIYTIYDQMGEPYYILERTEKALEQEALYVLNCKPMIPYLMKEVVGQWEVH
jgi:hypothetical protein